MAMNVDDSDKKDAIIFRQVLTSIFIMASHWKDIIKVNAQLVEAGCDQDTESWDDNKPTTVPLMKMKMSAVAFNKNNSD
jgi:hypothetical protein